MYTAQWPVSNIWYISLYPSSFVWMFWLFIGNKCVTNWGDTGPQILPHLSVSCRPLFFHPGHRSTLQQSFQGKIFGGGFWLLEKEKLEQTTDVRVSGLLSTSFLPKWKLASAAFLNKLPTADQALPRILHGVRNKDQSMDTLQNCNTADYIMGAISDNFSNHRWTHSIGSNTMAIW